jgi:hypothetical protein
VANPDVVDTERLIGYLDSTLNVLKSIHGHLEDPRANDRVQGSISTLSTLRQMIVANAFDPDAPPLDLGVVPQSEMSRMRAPSDQG